MAKVGLKRGSRCKRYKRTSAGKRCADFTKKRTTRKRRTTKRKTTRKRTTRRRRRR